MRNIEQIKKNIEDVKSLVTPEHDYHRGLETLDAELRAAHTDGILLDRLETICEAEKAGKLVVLPFIAMVEQSLQDGKMRPQADQKHNGRYAVVYVDKSKWGTPLIDICGTHYKTDQAESRRDALAALEGENKG